MEKIDEFLAPTASYDRLLKEYKEHGSLVIGYDFDNTVYDYHKKGESYEMVRQLLRDLKAIGCKTICWTANPDIAFVTSFLKENDIPCDGINTDGIVLGWETRKPFFSALLDDRSGLVHVYNDLRRLVDNVSKKTFYRVCNELSQRGLWYHYNGVFSGLIHGEFNFCSNSELKMDYDEELVGWLSATSNLEDLYNWFTKEDILRLQKEGWFIHKYETNDYKFYDKFQHYVINQYTSKVVEKIVLDEGI